MRRAGDRQGAGLVPMRETTKESMGFASPIESGTGVQVPSGVTTFLFTDIEGSTRLWEQEPEKMPLALARHDGIVRAAIERHRGQVVKMSGDGVHAAFGDPADAVCA